MDVNYLAVFLSGVGSMVLGFLWYSPMLFAKTWMKEIGLDEMTVEGGAGLGYGLTFVSALVMAAVTSSLVNSLNITGAFDGAKFGLMLGLGYVATTFASNYIFARKSKKLYLIDAGYQILNVTMSAMIAGMLR